MGSWGFGIFENDSAQDVLWKYHRFAMDILGETFNISDEVCVEEYGEKYSEEIALKIIDYGIKEEGYMSFAIQSELDSLDKNGGWGCSESVIALAKLEYLITGDVIEKERVIKVIQNFLGKEASYNVIQDVKNNRIINGDKSLFVEQQELLESLINNIKPKKLKSYREAISEAMGCDIFQLGSDI
ncbi:hypothetical protein [Clostridium perfringens]|uniref:hypothetical protein n=1 Tax=Clostridium perfringens TaxID=1502 RepID=UPI00096A37CD|nr:hypothetical protein [Clostridium perfringens]